MLWFAVAFLTRLPVPSHAHHVEASVRARAPLCFPFVGCVIGLLTAAVALGLGEFLPFPLAVLVALAVEARMTGAMHEDALADAGDALGGGWSRDDVLRILKDSRLGTYGTLALVFGIGLRFYAMISLPREWFLPCVVFAAGAGRWAMLWLLAILPPIPERASLSGDLGAGITPALRWVAGLPLLPVLIVLLADFGGQLLLAALLCAGFLAWYRAYLQRRLGGSTGDLLGASAFIGQLIVLIALCARF
jgi:adenosylcobinamide-GDP ribazoletransferase